MPLFPTNDILIYPALLLATLLITYTVYLLAEMAHEGSHIMAILITRSKLTQIKINWPTGITDPLIGIQLYFNPTSPFAQRLTAIAPWLILTPGFIAQTIVVLNTHTLADYLLLFVFIIALIPNQADYNALMNA